MDKYTYLEHTADVLFQAGGSTFNEMLKNAGLAMCNSVCGLNNVERKEAVEIEVKAKNKEELLHKFLEEVLFQIETRQMVFSNIRIILDGKRNALKAELLGDKINAEKHTIKTGVKAVTWHDFWVRKENNKWLCQVLLDV